MLILSFRNNDAVIKVGIHTLGFTFSNTPSSQLLYNVNKLLLNGFVFIQIKDELTYLSVEQLLDPLAVILSFQLSFKAAIVHHCQRRTVSTHKLSALKLTMDLQITKTTVNYK